MGKRSIRIFLRVLSLIAILRPLIPIVAWADILPYGYREHAYSGWNTSVSGDVRTVGMAGATVGLPDTFLSAQDNPAGLSMLVKDADDNIVGNNITDGNVQNTDSPIKTGSLGLAVSIYPWAVGVGYVTVSREGAPYFLSNSLDYGNVDVTTREFRLAVSRVFANDQFSLGLSFNLGQAEEQVEVLAGPDSPSVEHNYTVGATFGGIYKLPGHWLLGASVFTPMKYRFENAGNATPAIANFYQPVISPTRVGLGMGWIPNYYARIDASVFLVGANADAALLKDDQSLVGQHVTVQPRLGGAYIFADYKEFRGTAFAGSYYEMTRIENTSSRFHATGGLEFKAWLFTLGLGGDVSSGYSNVITAVGLDLVKTLMKLDIVPTPYSPPTKGLFPDFTHLSDDGLPRPMAKFWQAAGPDMNPIKIIQNIPGKLYDKFSSPPVEAPPAKKEKRKNKKKPESSPSV
jgi:hypothetical protein